MTDSAHDVVLVVVFFCEDNGKEPVREWLQALEKRDRKIIGIDIKTGGRLACRLYIAWAVVFGKCAARCLEGSRA